MYYLIIPCTDMPYTVDRLTDKLITGSAFQGTMDIYKCNRGNAQLMTDVDGWENLDHNPNDR